MIQPMKLFTYMFLALAFLGASSIYSAEAPAGDFQEQEQVFAFDATLGQEGTFQVVLKDGQTLGAVTAPGFELGPVTQLAEGLNPEGQHCILMGIPAKASSVGESDVTIEVLKADGTVDHVIRGHCTCYPK